MGKKRKPKTERTISGCELKNYSARVQAGTDTSLGRLGQPRKQMRQISMRFQTTGLGRFHQDRARRIVCVFSHHD